MALAPLTFLSQNNTQNVQKRKSTFSSSVAATAVQSDGSILMGGWFQHYGTLNRNYLVRVSASGVLDTAFCANASDSGALNFGVTAISVQADGKVLVGGAFTDYKGVTGRNHLIRLNSNGTLDTTFCSNATDGGKFNGQVLAICVQVDQKILVGGYFMDYAGTPSRNFLIRLNSDGTLDTTFCSNATDGAKFQDGVYAIVRDSLGSITVGGIFADYDGVAGRNQLVRLNSNGTLDTTFCSFAVDGYKFGALVVALALGPADYLLVAGFFTDYNGVTDRNFLIRLNSDGTLDTTFCSNAVDGAQFLSSCNALLVQADGAILVGGDFTDYKGVTGRNYLIRLNADGTLDTAFCANASNGAKFSGQMNAFAEQANTDLIIAGNFQDYAGGSGRSNLVRLTAAGLTDIAFCEAAVDGPRIPAGPAVIQAAPSGAIYVVSDFRNYGGVAGRDYLLQLTPDGNVNTVFEVGAVDGGKIVNVPQALLVQTNNDVLVMGSFQNYGGVTGRNSLVRISAQGVLDTAFCANAVDGKFGSGSLFAGAVQSDGKILIGGYFTNYAGTSGRNHLIRLNSNGTLDTTFCSNATDGTKFNATLIAVAVQSDGKILIGGVFTNYAGTSGRNYLIRLNADGTLDTAFCSNATDGTKFNAAINCISVQASGKILLGGYFTNYAGTSGRNRLIRLNADGTLDTTFCSNAVDGTKFNNAVSCLATRPDNSVVAGGLFTNYAGTSGRSYLVGLNSDGTTNGALCTAIVDNKLSLYTRSLLINNGALFVVGQNAAGYGAYQKFDSVFNLA